MTGFAEGTLSHSVFHCTKFAFSKAGLPHFFFQVRQRLQMNPFSIALITVYSIEREKKVRDTWGLPSPLFIIHKKKFHVQKVQRLWLTTKHPAGARTLQKQKTKKDFQKPLCSLEQQTLRKPCGYYVLLIGTFFCSFYLYNGFCNAVHHKGRMFLLLTSFTHVFE